MIRYKFCLSKFIYKLKSLESKSFIKVALILGATCICTEKTKLLIENYDRNWYLYLKCSWPFGGKHDFCIFDNSLFLFQIQIYCTCILIFNNDIFNNLSMAYYLSKFFISVNLNARTLSVSKMSGNILIINIRMSLSVYPKHWRVCW